MKISQFHLENHATSKFGICQSPGESPYGLFFQKKKTFPLLFERTWTGLSINSHLIASVQNARPVIPGSAYLFPLLHVGTCAFGGVQAKTKEDAGEKMTRHQKIEPRERREPLVCWTRMLPGPRVNALTARIWQAGGGPGSRDGRAGGSERKIPQPKRPHPGGPVMGSGFGHKRPLFRFKSIRCAVLYQDRH
jgi:hypothetical protein